MKDYAGGRNLRKKRKFYVDGMLSDEEEGENIERTLDHEDLVKTKSYPPYFVTECKGEDLTLEHFQRTGFKLPILVAEKTGPHIRIPDTSFSITDVRNLVGGKRILEVMNSATQSNAEMTLKDWEEFFTDPDRDGTKLNVISLEFSHTKLDSHVVAPRVIRQIDFIDNVWPRHFKEVQEEGSNDMAKMLYPKVQKYCLMSIAGCYTDFHVDLGGTSVWYHVLKGKKIFWLIPPNQANFKAFEQWTMSGKQSDLFFGDLVAKCGRVELNPGNTFFIPSGWIHAVYTPVDSLVFGGNYLHPFAIERQLKVAQVEETVKVPHKYRFPFFAEMMWFTLDKYCYALLGRHHLNVEENILNRLLGTEEERKQFVENIGHPYVTPEEVRGLKSIVLYLHSLPSNKKNVPAAIKDPVTLIRDIRTIVEVHKNDTQERAVNGRPLLYWPGLKNDVSTFCSVPKGQKRKLEGPAPRVNVECVRRLDPNVTCELCNLDGWWASTKMLNVDRNPVESTLMECIVCYMVAHPECLPDVGVDGKREEGGDPNRWTCPACVHQPPSAANAEPKQEVQSHGSGEFDGSAASIKEEAMEVEDSNVAALPSVSESKVWAVMQAIHNKQEKVKQASQVYQSRGAISLPESPLVIQPCLAFLSSPCQAIARQVCKAWAMLLPVSSTCKVVDISSSAVSTSRLTLVAQLQPEHLYLGSSGATKQQLGWLLPKLPNLKLLSLSNLDFPTAISFLASPSCPSTLTSLDLSKVAGLSDPSVNQVLRARNNLATLKSLNLAGTEVTDVSLRYIAQSLPSLARLVLSNCSKLTDAGLVQLGDTSLPLNLSIVNLDISNCHAISELAPLAPCPALRSLHLVGTAVTEENAHKFISSCKSKLKLYPGPVLASPRT